MLTEFENEPAYLGWLYDISERKQLEDQAEHMAFYDTLTDLPNRRMLHDRLQQTMSANKRSGKYGAVMFMDLDKFKPLNDTHGHVIGDLLLREVGRRITSCLREMDTVARFGGDEFVVVLSELSSDRQEAMAQAERVAEKIRLALAADYSLRVSKPNGSDVWIKHRCTASIGVALFIQKDPDDSDLMKQADAAMYQAKESGRNSIRFFQDAGNV